jgi:hypothetical protein
MEKIDSLPTTGPNWSCELVTVTGDVCDHSGKLVTEELQLWHRNPVDCVQELLGNPTFKDVIKYAPEKVYCDEDGKVRVFGETWTGDWWWELQVRDCSL